MDGKKKEKKDAAKKKITGSCESCEFFEDDEVYGPSCAVSLDEDEYLGFVEGRTGACPYYRRYDEYEVVRHQN